MIRSKSSWRFADFSSFESCSASVSARRSLSNCSRTGASTAAEPRLARASIARLELRLRPGARCRPRSSPSLAAARAMSSSTTRRPRAGPRARSARGSAAAWLLLELGGQVRVEPLRLAGLPRELLLRLAELDDLAVRELERLEQRLLGHLARRRPRPSSGRPSCRRRSGRASCPPRSPGSVGLTTSSPSIRPMRTAPTGPMNGSGEIISAAEAPLMHRMSCGVTRSADSTVQITCTSFRKPFGHSGRIGRSIMRAVRIARSVGRPSRLKKPPGILPAAYMRSSTSTVSGKKSAPSRGSIRPCAVASTIVSPDRTTTAPSACLASLPVSKVISRSPTVTETRRVPRSVAIAHLFFLHLLAKGGGLSQPPAARGSLKLPPFAGRGLGASA